MKTTLTTEQSQHLIDLGVPKEKAGISEDMYGPALFKLENFLNGEILPQWIEFANDKYGLSIKYNPIGRFKYEVCYDDLFYSFIFCYDELIDSLYELACWYYSEFLKSETK